MAKKWRVPVWRTIEVIENGVVEVEAETKDDAIKLACEKANLEPQWMELGDTVGCNPTQVDVEGYIDVVEVEAQR
jgi:translation initiation factor IF-1